MKHIYHFYADWCGPCHAIEPVWKKFVDENTDKAIFENVDTDTTEGQVLCDLYGITSIPAFVSAEPGRLQENVDAAKTIFSITTYEKLISLL
jgi:thioredoxin 1